MKKFIGKVIKVEGISEISPEAFNTILFNKIQEYESKGNYVDITFGGVSNKGNISALIIVREMILKNEAPSIKQKNRFLRLSNK